MKHPHDKTPRMRALQRFAAQAARQAGIRAPKIVGAPMTTAIPDEGSVPGATASPGRRGGRTITVNTNPRTAWGHAEFDDLSHAQAIRAQRDIDRFTMAHEVGHIAQPKLVGNAAKVQKYLAISGQGDRPLADPAVLARAGASAPAGYARDSWGMPTQGPGTTHSAPNESYADDFAASLGYGPMVSAARALAIRRLAKAGLVPKLKRGGPRVDPRLRRYTQFGS